MNRVGARSENSTIQAAQDGCYGWGILLRFLMRINHIAAVFLVTSFISTYAGSLPCGTTGMTVLHANDGSGFLFYIFREGPDIGFEIPGKQISFPNGLTGPRRYLIDGIFYETVLVKPKEFMKMEKGISDLDVLKKHQAYEFDFIQKTPTPLKKLVELGPREKPGANGQPGFTFYLWEAVDPDSTEGTRQYFLSTVSGGEVVVLSAIVSKQSMEDTAMQTFETYANSFQHILKKQQCPEKTTTTKP
jgi:hypothetical protein